MMSLCCEVVQALAGKSLVTAESITGGCIGGAITDVPGSSRVYKGGVICYTDWVKANILSVDPRLLDQHGAVSAPVALAMADGVRTLMKADAAVAVTGLAGPGGDDFGNPVGTVFIAYKDETVEQVRQWLFRGDRDQIRRQTLEAALRLVLKYNTTVSDGGKGL